MGRVPRERPRRLAAKLLQIRQALELTQEQMLTALRLDEKVFSSAISGYELGTREPPLLVLLKYARLAGVSMDVLVDDKLDLPAEGKGHAGRRKGIDRSG
jgi:transcriptional regulator with XRE-family HTH domain